MIADQSSGILAKSQILVAGLLLAVALLNLRVLLTGSPVVEIQLIMDEAHALSETESAFVVDYHHALQEDYGIDYRVITTSSPKPTDSIAGRRFAELSDESFSESGKGLLLVVNSRRQEVSLVVGSELEAIYAAPFVALVEGAQMTPFFRDGRVGEGVVAASELIVTRAQEAAKDINFNADSAQEPDAATVQIASPPPPESAEDITPMPDVSSEGNPIETINAYMQAMEEGNARPDLDIYTGGSQAMLKDWVVTKAQMRNVAREHRRCSGERYQIQGKLAVVQYDPEPGVCNPYLLRRQEGRWRIDFVGMQKYIRFDDNNHWSIPWGAGEFAFAFPALPEPLAAEDRCRWCFTFRQEDLIILSIDADSVGEKMGLKVGDRIVELDGEERPTMEWVYSHLYTVERGAMVRFTVLRDGKRIKLAHPAP
ncbi:PDZ domain-containing protein [Thiorhodococcus mannitoliphagus]|uniref:PDZ domain-containing protein n=1 Tax=Thiorhodococcus mannitoliphagus TaxID=329406 RepID=A0A6P1DQT7_9GAMM|nr:TPM domain-containing protein [Thiorhodococcus mannitoliphagus]NEX20627.1 PDZ domain-containing protein [Thiorhodococcus mannitoliphagus]